MRVTFISYPSEIQSIFFIFFYCYFLTKKV